jgi:metallo-beta-lactamase class B
MTFLRKLLVVALVFGSSISFLKAQAGDTPEKHVAAAKAAAGQEHLGLLARVCTEPEPAPAAPAAGNAQPRRTGPPPASEWHVEPAKVFDNLYFVGQKDVSSWAVTTSAGIIIIDSIWEYSVEDEIVGGLKKLGLNPADIKYVIVSHGHGDHVGGAKYLQDHFGAKIVLSAADWDLVYKDIRPEIRPKRDIVATNGQKITLGDETITVYVTPGHTPGALSMLIPVKDHGEPHLAAQWGGTAFNFAPTRANFQVYIDSARRFGEIAGKAGADVMIANHTATDGTITKLPLVAKRKPGEPHPYVSTKDTAKRYMKVAEECATAAMLRVK